MNDPALGCRFLSRASSRLVKRFSRVPFAAWSVPLFVRTSQALRTHESTTGERPTGCDGSGKHPIIGVGQGRGCWEFIEVGLGSANVGKQLT